MKVKLQRKKQPLKDIVRELVQHVQKYVKIKVLLLDRGFRDVQLFNDLEWMNVPLLMPCIRNEKAKKEFAKAGGRFHVAKYWLKNNKKEYADVKLLMIELGNGKKIGFYTTMRFIWLHTARYYLHLYARRWNIETGYRVQNLFLPKTSCVKGAVRYFYFCYAVAMHNLWIYLKSIVKDISFTVLTMKLLLVYFWISTHLVKET